MLIPTSVVRDVAEALTFYTGVLDFQLAFCSERGVTVLRGPNPRRG